jgi:hypothetical protein
MMNVGGGAKSSSSFSNNMRGDVAIERRVGYGVEAM